MALALQQHGITTQDAVDIELFDQSGAPIEQDTFHIIIKQFHRCDNFCVVIQLNSKGAFVLSSEVRCFFLFEQLSELKYTSLHEFTL